MPPHDFVGDVEAQSKALLAARVALGTWRAIEALEKVG
jgi:hypothetical protein